MQWHAIRKPAALRQPHPHRSPQTHLCHLEVANHTAGKGQVPASGRSARHSTAQCHQDVSQMPLGYPPSTRSLAYQRSKALSTETRRSKLLTTRPNTANILQAALAAAGELQWGSHTHFITMLKWLTVGCAGGKPTMTSLPRGASRASSALTSCWAETVSMMASRVPAHSTGAASKVIGRCTHAALRRTVTQVHAQLVTAAAG